MIKWLKEIKCTVKQQEYSMYKWLQLFLVHNDKFFLSKIGEERFEKIKWFVRCKKLHADWSLSTLHLECGKCKEFGILCIDEVDYNKWLMYKIFNQSKISFDDWKKLNDQMAA